MKRLALVFCSILIINLHARSDKPTQEESTSLQTSQKKNWDKESISRLIQIWEYGIEQNQKINEKKVDNLIASESERFRQNCMVEWGAIRSHLTMNSIDWWKLPKKNISELEEDIRNLDSENQKQEKKEDNQDKKSEKA